MNYLNEFNDGSCIIIELILNIFKTNRQQNIDTLENSPSLRKDFSHVLYSTIMCVKQILRRDFELLVKIRTYRVKYSNGMIQVMVRDYTIGCGHDIDIN